MTKPDYGIDAPAVMRNLFLFGALFLLIGIFAPPVIRLGPVSLTSRSFYWPSGFLIGEGLLFLLYVKFGKFRHRDFMLGLHVWRGDESVLDVGCGRGLLLAGAAKRLASLSGTGHVTGIDVWSNVDMGANSAAATQRNLDLEGVSSRCTVIGQPAQDMSFPDGTFDVILSNLCIHNIYDASTRRRALAQIVRVAAAFRNSGLIVEKRHGSFVTTFPPLTVVVASKPR
jgi:arsenite methyltransferase